MSLQGRAGLSPVSVVPDQDCTHRLPWCMTGIGLQRSWKTAPTLEHLLYATHALTGLLFMGSL